MSKLANKRFWIIVQSVAVTAAVVYSSWPLGYWLNPAVAKTALASGLEATGQPYNWVFVGGDVLSSLLMLVVCWLLWRHYHKIHYNPGLLKVVLGAVAVFSLGTIGDALLPEHCVPNYQKCPNFTHDHLLLVHGILSILASAALFINLCLLWWHQRRSQALSWLMIGYIVFGIISLLEAVLPGNYGNWSQQYYISLTSVWLALLPYAVHRNLIDNGPPDIIRQKSRYRLIRLVESLWGA